MHNDNRNSNKARTVALVAQQGEDWLAVPLSSKLDSHTGEQVPATRESGLTTQSVLSPLNAQTVANASILEGWGKVPKDIFSRLLDSVEHLL